MSAKERPEVRAFKELETLVRHLGEELATYRRRAVQAEAAVKELPPPAVRAKAANSERVSALEAENATLRTRLDHAEDRVRQMLDRVRFLRQQLQTQPQAAVGSRS